MSTTLELATTREQTIQTGSRIASALHQAVGRRRGSYRRLPHQSYVGVGLLVASWGELGDASLRPHIGALLGELFGGGTDTARQLARVLDVMEQLESILRPIYEAAREESKNADGVVKLAIHQLGAELLGAILTTDSMQLLFSALATQLLPPRR